MIKVDDRYRWLILFGLFDTAIIDGKFPNATVFNDAEYIVFFKEYQSHIYNEEIRQ